MKSTLLGLFWAALASFILTGKVLAVQPGQIPPPDVRLLDEMGVNLVNGQVVVSQDTVSIGGELGLSHGISMHTNHFSATHGIYGYQDRFAGSARYDELGRYISSPAEDNRVVYVMRLFGMGDSQNFLITIDGKSQNHVSGLIRENYGYRALGDRRHELELANNNRDLVWTKPDGTRLIYERPAEAHATSSGWLIKVMFANGHTLDIGHGGVTSNTGYQLKYEYEYDPADGTLSPEKQAKFNALPANNFVPWNEASRWASANPKWVRGINNAAIYCSTAPDIACSNTDRDRWPSAEFTWPAGMPRAVFLGESVFEVKDAAGSVTEYHYEAFDVMLRDNGNYAGEVGNGSGVYWPYDPGQMWSPRLVGIKSAGSKTVDRRYSYRNRFVLQGNGGTYTYVPLHEHGEVSGADGPKGEVYYARSPLQNGMEARRAGWHFGEYRVEPSSSAPGAIVQATIPKEGLYLFESGYRNFVTQKIPFKGRGPATRYSYTRGNLSAVIMPGSSITAEYPSQCTSSNRAFCNKPTSVTDARGRTTDYTYHTSGQSESVTLPPDENGVRPQTRYEYELWHAYYYTGPDTISRDDRGIWLLSRESSCRETGFAGSGCLGGAEDEVVIEYDYGPQDGRPNNLHLRRRSVTAMGDEEMEVRTSCYYYDIYGNRTGETAPMADKPSCY